MIKTQMVLLGIACAGAANAQVIDFQVLEHNDTQTLNHGFTYSEDGFTLNNDGIFEFATHGTLHNNYPGSTALFNNTVDGGTELVADSGDAFSLVSIDLAPLNGADAVTVTFEGFLDGNPVATESFTHSGTAIALETFTFSNDFANVDRVVWLQELPFHQFDNITIIPAPAGLALLGLGGLGVCRRRR